MKLPNFPFLRKKDPTDKTKIFVPSRRDFLKVSSISTGGLLLGVNFQYGSPKDEPTTFAPNAYLSINSDNIVSIIVHRSEMGTGIRTSLPMIIADELGADWKKVKIIQADGDEEKYGDQNTDGSYSVRMFYEPMRKAGATARHMLIAAAAEKWQVDASELHTEKGQVLHQNSDRKASFGELVEATTKMEIPAEETLQYKEFTNYKLIGKDVPIYDAKDIVTGKAVFGADIDLPGMQVAVIRRCPVVGGKITSYNDKEALAIPGVTQVVKIEGTGVPPGLNNPLEGLAVLADNTWAAIKGREALEINWDLGENQDFDSANQIESMLLSTQQEGKVRRERGNFENAKASASNVLEKTYQIPFYAHATMEPPAAIVDYKKDGLVEVWAPTQHPQWARESVATALDLPLDRVKVNVTLLGGGFGRKSKPDFVVEAALLSKAANKPVRVQWTREDDLHHDLYHSHSVQHINATLDQEGNLSGWNQHTVFPAIGATSDAAELHPSDGEMGLGILDFPYDIPNFRVESHESKAHTRIGWLRSVSNINHAFAICSMLDEIAETRGIDPVDQALDLLVDFGELSFQEEIIGSYSNYGEPVEAYPWDIFRMKKVIEKVAEEAQWKNSFSSGKAVGFAAHRSFLTYVACIVEVEKGPDGQLLIPEVHYAVDCGIAVNTDRVRSQFEGGAQFATSLATTSAITFKNGKVQQNNFDGYRVIRMPQSPKKIHVHIIDSMEKPTGVGEPPVPPFIPALCNAVYRLTGERIYNLPFEV